jgi:enoyl-CoA hydratase/carnithine racemase
MIALIIFLMKMPVDIEVRNHVAIITLNSEKSLNALSQLMINDITLALRSWQEDDEVKIVFLQGAGEKAFCAGGDIRYLYQALKKDEPETCLNFFITEYTLDHLIHTYPKPIIVWANGITMGGGIGLMNGASHRIVTESSLLAMPETSIGLYPDVGATWFLNRLPPGYGLFLGVTAARLQAADALHLGLADYFYHSGYREQLLQLLTTIEWSSAHEKNQEIVSSTLAKFEEACPTDSKTKRYEKIIASFAPVRSAEEFEAVLETMPDDEWFEAARKFHAQASPVSIGITIEQLNRGKSLTLEEVFRSELNLSVHCSQRADFPEGVRALLIDKDRDPKWTPASPELVHEYFSPHWSPSENPLKSL